MVLGAAQRLDPLPVGGRGLVDVPGDRRGADERDRGHLGVAQQRVNGLARAVDHVEHPVGETRFQEELGQPLAAKRRPLRRLEDERVPSDDGDREHPQRDHHGKVERRDAGAHADRVAIQVLVDASRDVAQRASLEQGGGAARKVHHLDSTPHLASRLFERLAVVAGDDRRQLLEVLLQHGLVAEHQTHPLHHGSP